MKTWDEFADWAIEQGAAEGGRKSLRRRWMALRELANQVAQEVPASEIEALFGKRYEQLDPENNDLKALIAYGAGRGLLSDSGALRRVLQTDMRADPLHFLTQHSGKTFGEKFAPLFAKFWLAEPEDGWEKQSSRGLFDVAWVPHGRHSPIRIELKASSEHPGYLFQQIRHPRLSGASKDDYDLLLCVGVSAGSLEWWAIPAKELERFAETGSTPSDTVVITRHHGKRRPIWNAEQGYTDEGWFRADLRTREILGEFSCPESEILREFILSKS